MSATEQNSQSTVAAAIRPGTVEVALALLWTAVALYALGLGAEMWRAASTGASGWIVFVVSSVILAVLVEFIRRRSNTARIIYTVLFVFGLLLQARDLGAVFASSPMTASLNVAMFSLQLAAILLLFSRQAAAWFRRSAGSTDGAG